MHKRNIIEETILDSVWYVDLCARKVTYTNQPSSFSDDSSKTQTRCFSQLQKSFTPKSWEILLSYFVNVKKQGQLTDLKLEIIKQNGTKGRMCLSSKAIFENGIGIAVISVVKDISGKQNMRNSLNREESLISDKIVFPKIGGWEFNLLTRKLNWTKEIYMIYELDESFDLNVKSAISFYPPASKRRLKSAVRNAIEYGSQYNLKLSLLTAKLNLIEVRTMGNVIYNDSGIPVKLFGLIEEVID